MKFSRLLITFAGLLVSVCYANVLGQEARSLEYGMVLEDEFPKDASEVEYRFSASTGDVVVIEVSVKTEDVLNGLSPELKLLNSRGSTLTETDDIQGGLENYDNFKSVIAIDIPSDDDYTILVVNSDFFQLQQDAPFALRLLKPVILEAGQPLTESATNFNEGYYVVISDQPFAIQYDKLGGSFFPAININRVESTGLERLSTIYGSGLVAGVSKVEPNRNTIHLVTVSRSPFDLDLYSENQVEYTIELVQE